MSNKLNIIFIVLAFLLLIWAAILFFPYDSPDIVINSPTTTTTTTITNCSKKASQLALAWGFEGAKEFCLPFTLLDRSSLPIPRFKFVNTSGTELGPCECKRNSCGSIHEALDVCRGFDLIKDRQQGNWTLAFVQPILYWEYEKGGISKVFEIVKGLPKVKDQTYVINFKHIDSVEYSNNVSILRDDLAYTAYDYEYTPALLVNSDYHISFPYNEVLPDRYDPKQPKKYLVTFRGKCHHSERIALSYTFQNYTGEDVIVEWKVPKLPEDDDVGNCHHYPHIKTKPAYWEMMQQSKFCFSPGGDVHFTMRQMDVISCGCIPVYIADNMTLPFSDIIPWRKISLFIPEVLIKKHNSTAILEYLRLFTEEEVRAIQERIHEVYVQYLMTMEGRSIGALHSFWIQRQRALSSGKSKTWTSN